MLETIREHGLPDAFGRADQNEHCSDAPSVRAISATNRFRCGPALPTRAWRHADFSETRNWPA